ncbi:response regulator [Candidatus Roizmanbacteria bacterium]|nr:response regulator [Candidatus Roizmanbacteria bacterium]
MKQIVVIDDYPGILEVVQIILEEKGYEVFPAKNAEEALFLLKLHKPNLILMDYRMAGTNGEELISQIKGKKQLCTIPIIVMSANHTIRERVLQKGAIDFIEKPFDIYDLVSVVEKYIQ